MLNEQIKEYGTNSTLQQLVKPYRLVGHEAQAWMYIPDKTQINIVKEMHPTHMVFTFYPVTLHISLVHVTFEIYSYILNLKYKSWWKLEFLMSIISPFHSSSLVLTFDSLLYAFKFTRFEESIPNKNWREEMHISFVHKLNSRIKHIIYFNKKWNIKAQHR